MKKKAKKELDVLEYMRSISNIPRYEPMKTTLIEWCEYWLSTRANNLKDSTRSSYEYVINNHFKRVFKDMRLEDLTADDVQLLLHLRKVCSPVERSLISSHSHGLMMLSLTNFSCSIRKLIRERLSNL